MNFKRASTPATLTVTTTAVAPTITAQPQSQTVLAGNYGLFGVTASGTGPLSYQWLKNGEPLAGETASEVLVLAQAADVGSSYRISVRVGNAVGSVTSEVATMNVVAPSSSGGTLIRASEGGVVTAGTNPDTDPTLVIPPNALSADTTISVTREASTVANLPPDMTPLGDVISLGPIGLTVASTVTLSLPIPDRIPEGKVLAVVEISGAADAKASGKATASASKAATSTANLRRLLTSAPQGGAVMVGIGDVLNTQCVDAQSIRGGRIIKDMGRLARYITAAVTEGMCLSLGTVKNRKTIPSTTTAPCLNRDFTVDGSVNLVSRHVHCQGGSVDDIRLSYAPPGKPTEYYGTYQLRWRIGSDGPATTLSKNYRVRLQLVPTDLVGAVPLTGLRVMPVFSCGEQNCSAAAITPRSLGSTQSLEIETSISFAWSGGNDTWTDFSFFQVFLHLAFPGENIDLGDHRIGLGQPPSIRCDKGMVAGGGSGCVYAQAPAVLVLSATDASVAEAAQHIQAAQNFKGARGGLTALDDRSFVAAPSNALQRSRVTGLSGNGSRDGANRGYACDYADSIIRLQPEFSRTCSGRGAESGCDCDEYPFSSTWNGAFLNRAGTSARYVNSSQNQSAGSRVGLFYLNERVLDLTPDPGVVFRIGNEAISVPPRVGGDDFWVHIE